MEQQARTSTRQHVKQPELTYSKPRNASPLKVAVDSDSLDCTRHLFTNTWRGYKMGRMWLSDSIHLIYTCTNSLCIESSLSWPIEVDRMCRRTPDIGAVSPERCRRFGAGSGIPEISAPPNTARRSESPDCRSWLIATLDHMRHRMSRR